MNAPKQPSDATTVRLLVEWAVAIVGGAALWWFSLGWGQSLFDSYFRPLQSRVSWASFLAHWAIFVVGGSAPVIIAFAILCFALRNRRMFWTGMAGCLVFATFFSNMRYGWHGPFGTMLPCSLIGVSIGAMASMLARSGSSKSSG